MGPVSTSESTSQRKNTQRVRAAHSYTPANEDELELRVGEIITVTNKEEEGWWEGSTADGKSGVFPSNFVEPLKESDTAATEDPESQDSEFQAIQGKKVKGIGFGNIFAGGPVKLKGAKKQESIDTPVQQNRASKSLKSNSPAPSADAPVLPPKDKQVWLLPVMPTKSKSWSGLPSPGLQQRPPPMQPQSKRFLMTGATMMEYSPRLSVDKEEAHLMGRLQISGIADIEKDECSKKPEYMEMDEGKGEASVVEEVEVANGNEVEGIADAESTFEVVADKILVIKDMVKAGRGSEEQDEFVDVWRRMTTPELLEYKIKNDDDDIHDGDDADHTSMDCVIADDSDGEGDDEDICEVYVPYSEDVPNESASDVPVVNESMLTNVSDLELCSFLSGGAGNASSASESTVALELSNLSHARETPPPRMTFRKRRSIGTPKNSPNLVVRSSVTPPNTERPPIKKSRVSPNALKADREGPLGVVPLEEIQNLNLEDQVDVAVRRPSKRVIDVVPEESFVEETVSHSTAETTTSPSMYQSAGESVDSSDSRTPYGEFFTPAGSLTDTSDETMIPVFSPRSGQEYHSTAQRKRVSFSPQDMYIHERSGRKTFIGNILSPLKFLRFHRTPSPTTSSSSKPVAGERITDSVKLARLKRTSTGNSVLFVKHKAVQVDIRPEMMNEATDIDPNMFIVMIDKDESNFEEDRLPVYVPYSTHDLPLNSGSKYDKELLHIAEGASTLPLSSNKVRRRSSIVNSIVSAFSTKKSKDQRRSQFYLDDTFDLNTIEIDGTATGINESLIQTNTPLKRSSSEPKLNPVLIDTIKCATLPLATKLTDTSNIPGNISGNISVKEDLTYFEYMQQQGRFPAGIRNIVNKYGIRPDLSIDDSRSSRMKSGQESSLLEDYSKVMAEEECILQKHGGKVDRQTDREDVEMERDVSTHMDSSVMRATQEAIAKKTVLHEVRKSMVEIRQDVNVLQAELLHEKALLENSLTPSKGDTSIPSYRIGNSDALMEDMPTKVGEEKMEEAAAAAAAVAKGTDAKAIVLLDISDISHPSLNSTPKQRRKRRGLVTPQYVGKALRVPYQQSDVVAYAQAEPVAKVMNKKLTHKESFFNKFKRRKMAVGKENITEDEVCDKVYEEAMSAKPAKPKRSMSLFRRLSLRFKGKNHDKLSRKQVENVAEANPEFSESCVTFGDESEVCLPDNSSGKKFNAKKDLFGNKSLPEIVVTPPNENAEDVPDNGIAATAATEGDSMKVLIGNDEQWNTHDDSWKILHSILHGSSSSSEKVRSVEDVYIDDELDDSMDLTGDAFIPKEPVDRIVLESVHTSTPTKDEKGILSASLEALFGTETNTNPLCGGDYIPKSPAFSSLNEDLQDLLEDTPEKAKLYYSVANHDLSPSVGGSGDADEGSCSLNA